ncbi:ABC transporter-like protein [Strigomonas culicis]|uniref:ABC transporter-like protein n=1 Tax=Strigomonas culicis TaxID=28005 RepID=S9UFQ0_9TRYP|nr:ABC transporter-like protein [Strigomonas culicis]|eukprot:EPY27549.1 ABC transporter-like protein [Strigomonas culicis]
MLYISAPLTLSTGLMVLLVQLLYLYAGRRQGTKGSRVADEESSATAYIANAMHRSETVFAFTCQNFILCRLQEKLEHLTLLTSQINFTIHGFAALSAGSTNLILIVVVSVANYLHRHGRLPLMDMALFVIYLQALFSSLFRLSHEASRMRVALGRLQTLKDTLEWYAAPPPPRAADAAAVPLRRLEDAAAQQQTAVGLSGVTFYYPEVPACLHQLMAQPRSAEKEHQGDDGPPLDPPEVAAGARPPRALYRKGITDVTFDAPARSITVLYGPSGCGKSTCLRLLCGLAHAAAGTVTTHVHTLLLEQQHAIFMGSVAENILLAATGAEGAERDRQRVDTAVVRSGAASFLSDPFATHIHNVAQPPFSGGQLQRLCLARVFASRERECTLVLLDEPTTGLDDAATRLLLATIRELRDVYHKTVIISSHDERVREMADKVVDLGRP